MNSVRERLARIPRRQLILGAVVVVVLLAVVVRLSGSGSGSGSSALSTTPTPVAAAPVHVTNATAPGARIITDTQTPAAFTAALRAQETIVVGFVMRGVADDDAVAAAIAGLAAPQQAVPGVRYLVYNVAKGDTYGDLATILGVSDTPAWSSLAPTGGSPTRGINTSTPR